MKKLTALIFALAVLIFPFFTAYASTTTDGQGGGDPTGTGVNIVINGTNSGVNPNADVSKVISNIISIVFAVAALMVLFMLILGAFNWITSGGEKEAVAKARNRITHALIGLLVLALAFLIVKVVGGLVNINVTNLHLPAIDQGA